MIYSIERFEGGVECVAAKFRLAFERGIRSTEISQTLEILERRFTGSNRVEGYLRSGPAAVAEFEFDSTDPNELRQQRLIRQRRVCDLIEPNDSIQQGSVPPLVVLSMGRGLQWRFLKRRIKCSKAQTQTVARSLPTVHSSNTGRNWVQTASCRVQVPRTR